MSDRGAEAFAVATNDVEGFEVVFAAGPAEAWAETSPCEGCTHDGECACYPCREVGREPAFDRFAPGPVPLSAYQDAGWAVRCRWCEDAGAYTDDSYAEGPGDWAAVHVGGEEMPLCFECRRSAELAERRTGGRAAAEEVMTGTTDAGVRP